MKKSSILVLASLLAIVACLPASAPAAELKAGAAAVKITPPLGIPLAGYYHARGAQGVLDDLYAKALVLDDGQTQVALVACDLITVPRHTVESSRQLIEDQTRIAGANVMISATHTHTGPSMPRESSKDELDGGSQDLAQTYAAGLPALIAQAVAEAQAKASPAILSYARDSEDRLAYCRRFWMKDGTVGWNPGKLNPQIVRPVSAIDPEVGVVYVETTEHAPLATYVNYAMHTDTTGGEQISADYPGVLAMRLAEYRGDGMQTLFGNGCCGDLNHYNVKWGGRQHGRDEAIRLGTILAASVMKAYMDLQPVDSVGLRVRREMLSLPLPAVSEEDVRKAEEVKQRGEKAPFFEQVQAYKVLDVAERDGKPLEVEVQVIALGDELAWVSLPGEVFVDIGLSIKAVSPFRQTHTVELANGSIGYIPNRSAYAEGNYEVMSARCGEGSGEMLVTAAARMLRDMYEEAKQ